MSESDGIEDALEGQLRIGLLVAGRVAEELARQRERAAREAEQQSLQAARDMQERTVAERATARAALVPLKRDAWRERATPHDIEAAWQAARQRQDVEPDARRATETIREQVRDRYDIDVDTLDPGRDDAVTRAMEARAQEQREAAERTGRGSDQERSSADQERVVATLLLTEATDERAAVQERSLGDQGGRFRPLASASAELEAVAHEQAGAAAAGRANAAETDRAGAPGAAAAAQEHSDVARGASAATHDSAQRRAQTQTRLETTLGPEHAKGIQARMLADTANARPAAYIAHQRNAATPAKADVGCPWSGGSVRPTASNAEHERPPAAGRRTVSSSSLRGSAAASCRRTGDVAGTPVEDRTRVSMRGGRLVGSPCARARSDPSGA